MPEESAVGILGDRSLMVNCNNHVLANPDLNNKSAGPINIKKRLMGMLADGGEQIYLVEHSHGDARRRWRVNVCGQRSCHMDMLA